MQLLSIIGILARAFFAQRTNLAIENLALRQQLAIVSRNTTRPRLRKRDQLFWRWKSRRRQGRPPIDREIRDLIRQISRENPIWGAPRIKAELRLLGYDIAESTVAKYRTKPIKPPSQTWRAFLKTHAE